ncbi:MAG: hypothetical protein ACI9FN_000359 [Saprospiraceae bacterium]|jgi:hypothetical protein
MDKIIILFALFLFSFGLSAQEITEGIWHTGKDNTKIETYQKEGGWFGRIVSSENKKAKIGKDILMGFAKEGNIWKGQLFAAKRDKVLEATITPHDNTLEITVSAGFFTKNLSWQKEEQNADAPD